MLLDSHGNGVDGAVASFLKERRNGVSELDDDCSGGKRSDSITMSAESAP
jgi:hypothetical protein